MSVVTGITLQMSCCEDYIEQGAGMRDIVPLADKLNQWLKDHHLGPLEPVEDIVLLINPEEGETRVFRPIGKTGA